MRGLPLLIFLIAVLSFAGANGAEYPIYDCAEYADEDQITPVPKPETPYSPRTVEEPLSRSRSIDLACGTPDGSMREVTCSCLVSTS